MIRVIVVDDQQLFRDLLAHMLEGSPDIHVVASAGNGFEAVDLAQQYQPDVILMDVQMPECNGIEATIRIKGLGIPSRILMLTASKDGEDVSEAMNQSVDGYILKSVSKEELILAVKSVHSGMEVVHHAVRHLAHDNSVQRPQAEGGKTLVRVHDMMVTLSEREISVIRMLIEGKTTGEMGHELFLAEGRIRNIITEILSKLMLKDRTQLAVFALKNKLVE